MTVPTKILVRPFHFIELAEQLSSTVLSLQKWQHSAKKGCCFQVTWVMLQCCWWGECCVSPHLLPPTPNPPWPPCLEQVRVGYLDLALLTGKWCQHISARFSKRGIRPTVDKLPYVKVGWHSRKLRDGSILQGQEICLLGPSAPCKQPWLLPFSVVLHLLNTLILVGITWQNELPLFFGLDLIQIEREAVNFHVGCAHLVFQFAGWTEKSEKKCKGDLRRFFPPHFLSGMKKGKIETNKSSNTKMKC